MTRKQVRDVLGILLISVHVVSLGLVVVGYFVGGFEFSEMTTAIGMMVPVFAAYTTLIVQFALRQRSRRGDGKEVDTLFVVTAFSFPLGFGLFLFAVVLAWIWGKGFESFEQFKTMLGLAEVVFGVYLAKIVRELFPE